MSTVYTADYRTLVRDQAGDANLVLGDNAQIDTYVLHAIREFSRFVPREYEIILPLVDEDKEVAIPSDLDDRMDIFRIETPIDDFPRMWRNWKEWAGYLLLMLDSYPDVTESTLTGTVTFNNASTSVTGSGTDFDGELVVGDCIKKSTEGNEWYQVRSIESDTALTLTRNYNGATGADTASVTPYRSTKEVCRIYWGGMHAITTTTTTIETKHEQLITDGAVIYAKRGWLGKARDQIVQAINTIAQASVPISEVTDEITQALADVTSGRSYIGSGDAGAIAAADQVQGVVAKALTALEQGAGYIATQHDEAREAIQKQIDAVRWALETVAVGEEYIDKVNVGDNVPGSFAQEIGSQLSIGQSQLQRAQSLLAQDAPAGELANFASGQLNAAVTLLNEVQAHLALDQPAGEYLNFATVTLNAVVSRLNQGSAILSESNSLMNAAASIYRTQMPEIDRELALWKQDLRNQRTDRSSRQYSRA